MIEIELINADDWGDEIKDQIKIMEDNDPEIQRLYMKKDKLTESIALIEQKILDLDARVMILSGGIVENND